MRTDIEELIPHRAPMRWIDSLTQCAEGTASATVCLGVGHYAVVDGALLEPALVECAAQTVAAALGHRLRAAGTSGARNQGMLAAVSNFRIASRPAAGETLAIEVRELKRLGPMLLVAATVSCGGEVIATGELSLYA